MEFAQLSLKTNNSIIGPYYAMQYKSFKKDFNNYMQNVTMKAHFENSLVSIKDIAYFTPTLNNIDQKVKLSFHFNGTVSDFETKDLVVNYNNSKVKGSFSMKGFSVDRCRSHWFASSARKLVRSSSWGNTLV